MEPTPKQRFIDELRDAGYSVEPLEPVSDSPENFRTLYALQITGNGLPGKFTPVIVESQDEPLMHEKIREHLRKYPR